MTIEKRGKSNKQKRASGKNQVWNNSGAHRSSNHSHQSRNPPGMEGKCMRWKTEHQPGQKCPAKNVKCKDCHKIGTLTQGMPVQGKDLDSQSCPDTTPG